MKKRARKIKLNKALKAIIFLICLAALFTGLFIFSQESQNKTDQIKDQFSETNETHWSHMPLTYNFNEVCKDIFYGKMKENIEQGLKYISDKTDNSVSFVKVNHQNPDIMFVCSYYSVQPRESFQEYIRAGEAVSWTDNETNIFSYGEVYLYGSNPCLNKKPVLVIHETLHLLGLDHNVNPSISGDILHPFITEYSCSNDILEKDIDYLKNIYNVQ